MQLHLVERLRQRTGIILSFVFLLTIGIVIAGCGGGGNGGSSGSTGPSPGVEVSSQTVRGVAATGSPLAGQVTLRDSSSTRKDKVTVIAADGSFSIVGLVWRPGQITRIHDHVTWCTFAVIQGVEHEVKLAFGHEGQAQYED